MKHVLMVLVALVVASAALGAGVLLRNVMNGQSPGGAGTQVTASSANTATKNAAVALAGAAAPGGGAEVRPEVEARTIRIAAGRSASLQDSQGHVWMADKGFEGGSTIERPELYVTGTKIPELYRAERYSMSGYSIAVPNGTYAVKLHFAECYDGNHDASARIFNFSVQGKEYKDFSPWKAAGAQFKAYVETVNPVAVTDGKLKIKFTAVAENAQICGIEVVPAE
jgi:hypothetical protein